MERQKGIAFCGLACALCAENTTCAGCRNEGCKDKDWCKNFKCFKTKGIKGCWECSEFPCSGGMLDNKRIRAFAAFVKEYGEEYLLDCLAKNEKAGVVYHNPGELTGDYDIPETEEGIFQMILDGK